MQTKAISSLWNTTGCLTVDLSQELTHTSTCLRFYCIAVVVLFSFFFSLLLAMFQDGYNGPTARSSEINPLTITALFPPNEFVVHYKILLKLRLTTMTPSKELWKIPGVGCERGGGMKIFFQSLPRTFIGMFWEQMRMCSCQEVLSLPPF